MVPFMNQPEDTAETEVAAAWFAKHRERYLDDLKTLAQIPSVSFPGFDAQEVRRCGEATAELLRQRGFDGVRLLEIDGAHPAVFGEIKVDDSAPTVLLYAHYDVQPAGDEAAWNSAPFVPTERQGRLYARGTADDKAAISIHTAAAESWQQGVGRLPLNIKFFAEGEEEAGSEHLGEFLEKYRDDLAADYLVVFDTLNFARGEPAITTVLRGLVAVDVEVSVAKEALHSGLWGGAVPDAAMALSKMLAALVDDDGAIAVPELLAKVADLTPDEQRALDALPVSRPRYAEEAGLLDGVELLGKKSPFELNWRAPSLVVNAIQASSRADARNILVESAWARVGVRIVPDMEPEPTRVALETALRDAAPWGVKVNVTEKALGGPWGTDTGHPAFAAASAALRYGYNKEPVMMGCGATIPFIEPMCDGLGGIPALLLGIEDPHTRAHGENESLALDDWESAAKSLIALFDRLAALNAPTAA